MTGGAWEFWGTVQTCERSSRASERARDRGPEEPERPPTLPCVCEQSGSSKKSPPRDDPRRMLSRMRATLSASPRRCRRLSRLCRRLCRRQSRQSRQRCDVGRMHASSRARWQIVRVCGLRESVTHTAVRRPVPRPAGGVFVVVVSSPRYRGSQRRIEPPRDFHDGRPNCVLLTD